MNAWLSAATVLLVAALGPALAAACRGTAAARLAGLALAGPAGCAVLLLLAQGFDRAAAYTDVALVLAVLTPTGTLVFARFLGGDSAARAEPGSSGSGSSGSGSSGTGSSGTGAGERR
ncbi:monovalent cation/H+ antiporter complex subunit F [Streptomyces sp. NPDC092296]|uniref:monovalent cation/H+ antiporter complex subunit F n=1 Tax=Streptomyces sp. NPDC092296 TaxID=3366012 RepID=UPI00382D379F